MSARTLTTSLGSTRFLMPITFMLVLAEIKRAGLALNIRIALGQTATSEIKAENLNKGLYMMRAASKRATDSQAKTHNLGETYSIHMGVRYCARGFPGSVCSNRTKHCRTSRQSKNAEVCNRRALRGVW